MGFEGEDRKMYERIVDAAEKLQVKYVISPECGHAYTALRWEGPNLIGKPYKFKVIHILELLDQLYQEGRLQLEGKDSEKLTFHDPCQIVRRGGVLEEPRKLLNLVADDFVDMPCSGKWNWCCGGGGGMKTNYPEVANKAAKIRAKQAEELKVKKIVTCCPLCKEHLKENSGKINVLELSEVIDLE